MAVVTVSRQFGSGGDQIASRVCELLGYGYFDKRLMARVASEVGLSEGEILDASEDNYRVAGFWDRLFNRKAAQVAQVRSWTVNTAGVRVAEVAEIDFDQAITMVRGTIEAAYGEGDVVIVGRAGQVVLQDRPGVLHVRVEAPVVVRQTRIQQQEHLSASEAQEMVFQKDRAAAEYLKHFYGVDWADSSLYHLVINTAKWDTESAAQIVVNAVQSLPAA